MNSPTPLLQLHAGLAIGYDRPLAALRDEVTLENGVHFLLARNGRGKTTLLRTIAGTIKSLKGRIDTRGHLQFLPEDLRFDPELPVQSLFRAIIPKTAQAQAFELARQIDLDTHKPYGKLSTGNRKKANLIVAEFSVNPAAGNILLLDEPFSGLDAYAREIFETHWQESSSKVLRLVSCHPDYDSMSMPSVLLIQDGQLLHTVGSSQTWNLLKHQLN